MNLPAPLAGNPDAELRLELDHVLALRQTVSPDFFFVQIGAFDGRMDDPLYAWVRGSGWRGLLVEPQARFFEQLRDNYRGQDELEFRRVAVTAGEREERTLWTVAEEPDVPEWAGMLASFDRETLLSHREFLPEIDRLVQGEEVECVPINALLEEAGAAHIDLLQMDVEGYDHELLGALDLDRFSPSIIHFEHAHLGRSEHDRCIERLLSHGYRVALEPRDTLAHKPQGREGEEDVAREGPNQLQAEFDRRLKVDREAHAAHVRELERRLEAATAWTDQVQRDAAAFRERSLEEQSSFLNARIEEALSRAESAEQRLSELEAERDQH